MNVWNKVLMALITIECVVFGILAANKYQLTKNQDEAIAKLEAELAKVNADIQQLRYDVYGGTPDKTAENWRELGLDGQLTYVRGLQRGEAFANCSPVEARVDEENHSSKIAFGIDPRDKTTAFRTGVVAFVFDSGAAIQKVVAGNEGNDATGEDSADESDDATVASFGVYKFLGAFKVTGATDSQVNLESIGNASAAELSALRDSARSGNSWVVYADRLPMDSPADVAYFESEFPGRSDSLPEATAAFVNKTFTIEDARAAAEDRELAEGSRYPVDFQGTLATRWSERDRQNLVNSRNTLALETLTTVIANQFVAIGDEVEDETVLAFKNWDDIYSAAVERRKVDSWRENIEKTEAELKRMIGYRDLAKKVLDSAKRGVEDCRQAIDELISENAATAAKIAQAQFLALEKAEAASKTAANGATKDGEI